MKSDIAGIRNSSAILKKSKSSLVESKSILDDIIATLEDNDRYESVRQSFKQMKRRINQNYIEIERELIKWINNKADKLEESEKLNKDLLYTKTISIASISSVPAIKKNGIESIKDALNFDTDITQDSSQKSEDQFEDAQIADAEITDAENPQTVKKIIDGKEVTLPAGDKVYFLDTGWKRNYNDVQRGSDCFLIESNGKYGLIDTGKSQTSDRVLNTLKDLGITELDFVLITHGHNDHTGGYKAISEEVKINNLYVKESYIDEYDKESGKYKHMDKVLNIAHKQGTNIVSVNEDNNRTIELGNFTFELFNTKDRSADGVEINDNVDTLTALAVANGKSIYFSGDIGNYPDSNGKMVNAGTASAKDVKNYLESHGLGSSVDVYKTAHHSHSNYNNSQAELDLLQPKNSVTTIGKKRVNNDQDFLTAKKRIKKFVDKANRTNVIYNWRNSSIKCCK